MKRSKGTCCICKRRQTDGMHRKCNRCRNRFNEIDTCAADAQAIRAAMVRAGVPVRAEGIK